MINKNQQKEQNSLQNLKQLREHLRKEAEEAVRQIKNNQFLSLAQIRQAEDLFDNIEDTNKYLKQKNQARRKSESKSKQKDKLQSKLKPKQKRLNKRNELKQADKHGKQELKSAPKINQMSFNNEEMIEQQLAFGDENRRWDENTEHMKKGKFEPHQKKLLANSLSQFLVRNNIQLHQFVESVRTSDSEGWIPNGIKLWTNVCSVLPNRSLKSCYRYLLRTITKQNKTAKWSQDEVEKLVNLQDKLGNKWEQIGKELGRPAEAARDKFRNIKKHINQPKEIWQIQQLVNLFKQIQHKCKNKFLKEEQANVLLLNPGIHNQQQRNSDNKYNSKFMLSHNMMQLMEVLSADELGKVDTSSIKWKQISEKMQHRTESECKNKFVQVMQMFNRDYDGKSQAKIIMFIKDQLENKEFIQSSIDWKKWNPHKMEFTEYEARCKWSMMKRKILNRQEKSFKQIFEQAQLKNKNKVERFQQQQCKIEQQMAQVRQQKQKILAYQKELKNNKKSEILVQKQSMEILEKTTKVTGLKKLQKNSKKIENQNLRQKQKCQQQVGETQLKQKKKIKSGINKNRCKQIVTGEQQLQSMNDEYQEKYQVKNETNKKNSQKNTKKSIPKQQNNTEMKTINLSFMNRT